MLQSVVDKGRGRWEGHFSCDCSNVGIVEISASSKEEAWRKGQLMDLRCDRCKRLQRKNR